MQDGRTIKDYMKEGRKDYKKEGLYARRNNDGTIQSNEGLYEGPCEGRKYGLYERTEEGLNEGKKEGRTLRRKKKGKTM